MPISKVHDETSVFHGCKKQHEITVKYGVPFFFNSPFSFVPVFPVVTQQKPHVLILSKQSHTLAADFFSIELIDRIKEVYVTSGNYKTVKI